MEFKREVGESMEGAAVAGLSSAAGKTKFNGIVVAALMMYVALVWG